MNIDRTTLNLAAPILCTIGSLAALIAALRASGPGNKSSVLSSLFGVVGSAAWAMAAYQDSLDDDLTVLVDA